MGGMKATRVKAQTFIKKMRGGSQPILAKADDGYLYVVKFVDNPQGQNLAFNESLGNTIYRACGLPGPEWVAMHVSDRFLDRAPGSWIQTETGCYRPQPGWCFGTRFLATRETIVREILPGSSLNRILNRQDFWKAWVLDVLCEHSDNRQALFFEAQSGQMKAYFIDHGHMFAGPRGIDSPKLATAFYLDRRIYETKVTDADCNVASEALKSVDYKKLTQIVASLPAEWKTESAILRFREFLDRASDPAFLGNLETLLRDLLGNRGKGNENWVEQPLARTQSSGLCSQVFRSRGFSDEGSGGPDNPARSDDEFRLGSLCAQQV
jgi:hypothetical protein